MMFDILRSAQLDIMLVLSGICAILALFVLLTDSMDKSRKRSLLYIELSGCFLLYFDRLAYIYRGDTSLTGYYMVRIANFLVFFLTLSLLHAFSMYLITLSMDEGQMEKPPKRLVAAEILVMVGWSMLIISEFTGVYYYFDESNIYHRGPLFFICYLIPFIVLGLQLSVIFMLYNKLSKRIAVSLLFFTVVPVAATITQMFTYGLSLSNIAIAGTAIVLYIIALIETNENLARSRNLEIEHLKREQESMERLFEETASAIASAIDAKDRYSKGHSIRVANYAREIARRSGRDEKTVDETYYAGLLHDVGKIGISDDIIAKDSGLTDEENEIMKTHSVIGRDILSLIKEFPYLSVAAAYHHERYDGRGYPDGLKGKDIPETARIVAVADTYDAMTSSRSYREPLPQDTVREEMVKGSGTQFDPEFAKIMVNMIDEDVNYRLREKDESGEGIGNVDLTSVHEMHFGEYKERISDGIAVTNNIVRIHLNTHSDPGADSRISRPSLILFDSNDGCVHKSGRQIKNLHYLEYGEIWTDGHFICTAARDMKCDVKELETSAGTGLKPNETHYDIEAVRIKDHVRIKISDGSKLVDVTAALPDSVRFSYIAFTGEHCEIDHVEVEETDTAVPEDYITRLVEEVTYINRIEGDIPNIQINGYRLLTSKAVPVRDRMKLTFHTMSLPTASLVWHCSYILLYSSPGMKVNGSGYQEYACIRLDGEDATYEGKAENQLEVKKGEEFRGWDGWKDYTKKGFDCEVRFKRRRNKITFTTENYGISIKCTTVIPDNSGELYLALTGDQCALTDIRVF